MPDSARLEKAAPMVDTYVIDPPAIAALPVAGSDQWFPVHRVYCVGRNYAAHAVEMGHDPNKEPPFFFQKNPDNLDTSGEFPYPPASKIGHPSQGAVWLDVNGERKQTGDLNQMIWKVPEMISYLSGLFRLAPGDIIMSGTPAGVGAVKRGEVLKGHVDGVGDIEVRVV